MEGVDTDEGYLERLLGDVDVVVWEADARSLAFRYLSGGAERVLGRPASVWLADPGAFSAQLHPDDRPDVLGGLLAASHGTPLDVQHRFTTAEGERWLHTTARLVQAPMMPVIRGTSVDVTRARAADGGRAEAEGRFRKVVERMAAIVSLEAAEQPQPGATSGPGFGAPGRLLYVSPQLVDILGATPEEWIEDPTAWARQFHPDDVERVREEFSRVASGEGPFVAEYRMFAADGRVVWFHDEAVLVRDEHGTPQFWQGIMTDVTGRRLDQERIADAEQRYRTLVEQLPAIVYSENVTDDGLQVVYINSRVAEVLGVTPDEWVADPGVWQRAIHPDDVDEVMAEDERTERTGEPFEVEYRMVARDGRIVWFHDVARLVRRPGGEPAFWQGVMTDVTARKEAEFRLAEAEGAADRLREADEVKNVFLRAVSHDLRGPLAAILGLASTLERRDLELSGEDAHDLAGRIASNARKLDRIVSDLLDLDRLERGMVTASLATTDVGSAVREMVAGSDAVAGRRVHLDTAPVTVQADIVMVERIIDNLLRNAVRHTPATSRIWVRVMPDAHGALLVVEDDGPGVPVDDRARIFEPFDQGAGASVHPGVGIGLAVVARFAELHGGRAWVQEREGGGASFRVALAGEPALSRATAEARP